MCWAFEGVFGHRTEGFCSGILVRLLWRDEAGMGAKLLIELTMVALSKSLSPWEVESGELLRV